MKCSFANKRGKECDLHCQYYHTCTRSEYYKKERQEDGKQKNVHDEDMR